MIRPAAGDAHTSRVSAVYSGISRAVRITTATCTVATRDVKTYKGNTSGAIQEASLTYGFAGGAYSLDITGPDEETTTVEQITVSPLGLELSARLNREPS